MHSNQILHRDIKPENIVLIMVSFFLISRAMLNCVILDGQSIRLRKRNLGVLSVARLCISRRSCSRGRNMMRRSISGQ